MKKVSLLLSLILCSCIFLVWCEQEEPQEETNNQQNVSTNKQISLFWEREAPIGYKTKMEKPSFDDMDNKDAIQQEIWYQDWDQEYTLTEEDIKLLEESKEYCSDGYRLTAYWSRQLPDEKRSVKIGDNDLQVWKTFTIHWQYEWTNIYPLSWTILDQMKKHWFWIGEFSDYSQYILPRYDSNFGVFNQEEWVDRIRNIWWTLRQEYERYPFNTLLVSNDLLLHVFHKIFSNELQYFEESEARPILANLSSTFFNYFKDLEDEEELSDFLTAYWAIPYALLPSNEWLREKIGEKEASMWENWDYRSWEEPQAELTDQELRTFLTERFEAILNGVPNKYHNALRAAWKEIRDANTSKTWDALLLEFSPDFIMEHAIDQDYTQFRPRSHYTNSSFLKTYFMASKWLMREKFYIGDKNLASAALFLAENVNDQPIYQDMLDLQDAIRNLVGSDDDIGVEELVEFYNKELNGDIHALTDEKLDQLLNTTTKQRITWASYSTATEFETDENASKDMLNGFVFFGEKFTIDSYIFDLLTAWTAEKEYVQKPNMQTALIVPDILENNDLANSLVNLWLDGKSTTSVFENKECWQDGNGVVTCFHISSYPEIKNAAQEKVEQAFIEDAALKSTVYHRWLEALWQLFTPVKNIPYFKEGKLYALKNLATYLGSYTELKHDTLLYAKQAYAEMGWGGDWGCEIIVYPPELPVPKGYVEGDVNFIDKLIELNKFVTQRFDNKDMFEEFWKYLEHIRAIALQQMNNEVISDEDFEYLRFSWDKIAEVTVPRKVFWEASAKEERAALIADIFTSEWGNPLYEAVGRPLLMAVMIDDANGKRVVLWPIFSHYEFYKSDNVLEGDQRYSDEDWQGKYDTFSKETKMDAYGIEEQLLVNGLNEN